MIIRINSVGRTGFEPVKSKDSGFTVRPIWPLWNLPNLFFLPGAFQSVTLPSQQRDSNPRPTDYKSVALAN